MQHTIGIGEMKISQDPQDVLVTYSLGSCIGLSLYDPALKVGGLIHCMLPLSRTSPDKARENPERFTDTGVVALMREMLNAGCSKKRLIAKAIGAAKMLDENNLFRIGERNYTVMRKILWKNDILLCAEDVGGTISRTVYLKIDDGRTIVKSGGKEREL